MTPLGACPHCKARIFPLRVFRINRATPYECATCKGRAVIRPRDGMLAMVAYVGALAIPLFALDYVGVSPVVLFVACVVAVVATPWVLARFCRFETSLDGSREPGHDA